MTSPVTIGPLTEPALKTPRALETGSSNRLSGARSVMVGVALGGAMWAVLLRVVFAHLTK